MLAAVVARAADLPENSLITLQPGTLPIVLSAPHGGHSPIPGVPPRQGDGAKRFAAMTDANTAELAALFAARLQQQLGGKPYLVIARFERKYLDVNRAARDAYESEGARRVYEAYQRALMADCAEVRRRWTNGLLIDLHGQSENPAAIFRGTTSGKTVASLLQRHGEPAFLGPDSIFGQLHAKGVPILPSLKLADPETSFNGGYIVNAYGSHQPGGLDAIQIEVGSNFRKKEVLDRTASWLADATAVFYRRYLAAKKN